MKSNLPPRYCLYPTLLVALGLIVFWPSLGIRPSLADDLMMFSSAARASNPFIYFVSDWGVGGHMYRPLLSMSYWLIYHAFGASGPANQGLSLVFHLVAVLIAYRLLKNTGAEALTAVLFSGLILFSMFSVVPATLGTDRCSLFVGISLLLLLLHKTNADNAGLPLHPAAVGLLCVLALTGKESGVIVAALAFFMSLQRAPNGSRSWSAAATVVPVSLAYVALRLAIFGHSAGRYGNATFAPADTAENFLASLSAAFLPVYARDPGIVGLLKRMPAVLPTVLLWILVVRRPLTTLQKWCLAAIVLNAGVHAYEFRYRFIYLAHIAFSVFVGSSQALRENPVTRRCAHVTVAALLIYNMYWVTGHIRNERNARLELIRHHLLQSAEDAQKGMIDDRVRDEVLKAG